MPISLSCPCGAKLNVPDGAAGKRVKCPRCGDPLAVPAAAGFEVVDEDHRPVRSRRRDDDEEDEDDRPRKAKGKKKAKKSAGVPVRVWAAGGGAVLVVGVIVAVLALGGKKDDGKGGGGGGDTASGATDGGGAGSGSVPPGFDLVNDRDIGFRCLLPNKARRGHQFATNNPTIVAQSGTNWADWQSELPGVVEEASVLVYTAKSKTYGTTPDALLDAARAVTWSPIGSNDVILAKTPVTVDGRPGLDLRYREARFAEIVGKDNPERGEFFKDQDGGSLRHNALRVVADGNRLFLVHLRDCKKEPDPQVVKTVFDSFTIR